MNEAGGATQPSFKVPRGVDGDGRIPGDHQQKPEAKPHGESAHAVSERLTDYWRKVDFIFGIQRPIIHASYPIAVTRL